MEELKCMDVVDILIVDDKQENLISLEALLEDNPALNIVKASSGNEALQKMLEYEFALILLDVKMPDMDGFEIANLMRENEKTRHIPIVFVTANDNEPQTVVEGYESGAIDFLFKPIDPRILKNKISVFMELYLQKKIINQKVIELEKVKNKLEDANDCLTKLSHTDELTKLANRRRFNEFYYWEWKRMLRDNESISIIMMDIDYFKNYNDKYGHQEGDNCLVQVAKALCTVLNRANDLIARYGGEEFIVVLSKTNYNGAVYIAESILKEINSLNIEHSESSVSDHVTISIGVATIIPTIDMNPDMLVKIADEQLYLAKSSGRNQVKSIAK